MKVRMYVSIHFRSYQIHFILQHYYDFSLTKIYKIQNERVKFYLNLKLALHNLFLKRTTLLKKHFSHLHFPYKDTEYHCLVV